MKNAKIFRRTIPTAGSVQVRASEDGEAESRTIEGYAITFGTPSVVMGYERDTEIREYIAPEAVTEDVLNRSDIKLTIEHDGSLLLGRSRNGHGSLTYGIDDHGVWFKCEMPRTVYGDHALEAIRRGDIAGCSFMFTVSMEDPDAVTREEADGEVRYVVRNIERLYDFTLTASPAYPATEVERRSIAEILGNDVPHEEHDNAEIEAQLAEMRSQASLKNAIK